MTKYIVVVGGVISGVGKGVATASMGKMLQKHGFSVTALKIDPYLNCDAGTMRPTEHGEVWVTDNGGEIDQDLGNYERFLGIGIPKENNITSGQIYKTLIDKERKGDFLGETVQAIPHVPDEIKRRVKVASKDFDIAMIEIGGTVGDYENIPFLNAMSSLEKDIGKENIIYVLVSYLPVPSHIEEMKTKPTQLAIRMLREAGIRPDLVFCRGQTTLDAIRKKKISDYSNLNPEDVISMPDVIGKGTANTLYVIPLNLDEENLDLKVLEKLHLMPKTKPDWSEWRDLVNKITNPKDQVKIAMVGKYLNVGKFTLKDSYYSISQALQHAGAHLNVGVDIEWVDAKTFDENDLKEYDGILIPGGFGSSGVEGKIRAIQVARENNIPFLGLCYGMQLALIEYARNVCGLQFANTMEVNNKTPYPIIDILDSQKEVTEKGGTMRLGAYAAILNPSSKTFQLYKETGRLETDKQQVLELKEEFRLGKLESENVILERHRHRYEVNPKFIPNLVQKGICFSGHHIREDGTKLMEFIELPDHKFFMATQAHPEFKSRLSDPAPLFLGFIRACNEKN
ncbi:CTP synthase [Candidatus Woesearchaeota archaeon]|jgi:CTP synthase|nr:CTP synthase [Candidatus Woesearchaeota archaeon]MBT4368219.1 CTP synthase [Candidatus Woesearchaeota archaeon]MBT4712708.1 CTP synthase [Candidatus Woesearchaeota archaeon]MBT6639620.1 CTP synthase [Candidatus Woesearchaeota archaeon]MBT7133792.1 CTP synthase [Candidatus Woesearchaeota archaeon]